MSIASRPPVGYSNDAARMPCFTYICPSCGRASIPTNTHLLLASRGPGGEIRAVGTGVVVRIHEIDNGEAGECGFHFLPRIGLEPLHVRFEHDLECRSP